MAQGAAADDPAAGPRGAVRTASRSRLGVITIDQAVSGGSNVLVTVLAARGLGVGEFGLFGVLFLTTVFAVGLVRALVSEPLLVHPTDAEDRSASVVGSAVVVSMMGSAVVAVAALLAAAASPSLALSLLVTAGCLPLVAVQDLGRYLSVARRRPGYALVSDLFWLVLMVVAIAVVQWRWEPSLAGYVAAWVGAGAVAGLVTLVRFGARERPGLRWLRQRWNFSWRYLASFGANQGGVLVSSTLLGVIAGAAALGGVRGALLLQRPFSAIHVAAAASGISDVARERPRGNALLRGVGGVMVLPVLAAIVNGAVLVLLPDPVGRFFLGDTWAWTRDLRLPAAVHILLVALCLGPRVGVIGSLETRRMLSLDLVLVPLGVFVSLAGAVVAGASGYFWGLVLAQIVVLIAWYAALSRVLSAPTGSSTV